MVRAYNMWGDVSSAASSRSLVQVSVRGMKCQACAARLRQAVQAELSQQPWASCSVDFEGSKVNVVNSHLSGEDLLGIVRMQGFDGSIVVSSPYVFTENAEL